MATQDPEILGRIGALVDEEHQLRSRHGNDPLRHLHQMDRTRPLTVRTPAPVLDRLPGCGLVATVGSRPRRW